MATETDVANILSHKRYPYQRKNLHLVLNRGISSLTYAPVAQLDRVPDYESVGRRFESCLAYQ